MRREAESRPIAEAFFETLQKWMTQSETPPVNTRYRAILHALERRETLMTWLKSPQIPIDNNAVERAIRPLAVGRRNSLLISLPKAGKRAAILDALVRECQRVKADYLDLPPSMPELPEAGGRATSAKV